MDDMLGKFESTTVNFISSFEVVCDCSFIIIFNTIIINSTRSRSLNLLRFQ